MARPGADSSERALNLAMYLSSIDGYVSLDDILVRVEGYDTNADEATVARMFEHDKDFLRSCGFALLTHEDDNSLYRIDSSASFADDLDLQVHEAATMRVVGGLMLGDPTFPLRSDLRLALVKLAESLDGTDSFADTGRVGVTAGIGAAGDHDDLPATVALCTTAIETRKELTFSYPTPDAKSRTVMAYGLFNYETSWYLVAFDHSKHDMRVFNCERIHDATLNSKSPKTPDYEIPEDFDVARYRGLPFQYGVEKPLVARVELDHDVAWRAMRLTQGVGELEFMEDGPTDSESSGDDPAKESSAVWTVEVRNHERFLQWLIANGPGLSIMPPVELRDELREGLSKVVSAHG